MEILVCLQPRDGSLALAPFPREKYVRWKRPQVEGRGLASRAGGEDLFHARVETEAWGFGGRVERLRGSGGGDVAVGGSIR